MRRAYEFTVAKAHRHADWHLAYGPLEFRLDQHGKVKTVAASGSGVWPAKEVLEALRNAIHTAVLAYGVERGLRRVSRGSDGKRKLLEYVATYLNETIPPVTWRDSEESAA